MALLLTILFFVFIALVIYRIYVDWHYITKKRKYNKSADALSWYVGLTPFKRFLFWPYHKVIIKRYNYKILKDEETEDEINDQTKA
ncbi:MAG: hypothetical protein EOO91_08150 [Pedobacter sp.]|nr:MAG: hypothetical protein EOO91_08150 [Pedobacter sp.]